MEEDILKEPIKEEVKEELIEEVKEQNNTKSATNNAIYAKSLKVRIIFQSDGSWYQNNYNVDVSDLVIGTEYTLTCLYDNNSKTIDLPVNGGSYIRGSEPIDYNQSNRISGINGFDTSILGTSSSVNINIISVPTPEPTPVPTPEPIDPETISGNELLREILITERSIAQNVQSIADRPVYICVSDNNVSDNQIISVNSIMDKPINDYTVSESLLMFMALSLFIGGIVVIIRKGLPICR